ncbi:MAG: aminoglycoside phosphotransferase family protein [Clostridia bacterium]|nr:aminoglycoside phosphotransferase family protein [Clostridia bacterium]
MEKNLIYNLKDDFEKIIAQCPIIINSRFLNAIPLNNGKSSFCFSVQTDNAKYIFKFPRTIFQYRSVEYEKSVVSSLYKRIICEIPKINVYVDGDMRPYIVYEQIEGEDMADTKLTEDEARNLCRQLVQNLIRIHSLKQEDLNFPLITKKQSLINFSAEFNYQPKFDLIEDVLAENSVIHGDFHRKNIILDTHKKLSGIIDFTTFSTGSIYFDIGHFVFSTKEGLGTIFLDEYQRVTNMKIDEDKLTRVIDFLYDLIKKNYLPFINSQG